MKVKGHGGRKRKLGKAENGLGIRGLGFLSAF
jgi:hypothetical protein